MKIILGNLILRYFRFFAVLQLKKNPKATIIGITGSAGKTSTRGAVVEILKHRGIVKETIGANSESGIPLDILGLHPNSYSRLDWLRLILLTPWQYLTFQEHFDYYVVEMGIDSPDAPKNMSYLLSIIRPHVGIILNANLTHAANFDYLVKDQNPQRRAGKLIKLVAKEKMLLARGLQKGGVAIVNIDQKDLAIGLRDVTARKITVGKSEKANVRIVEVNNSRKGFLFRFSYQGFMYKLVLSDILSDQYAYTLGTAIAAASALGIPPSVSLESLSHYLAPPGRMRIFPGMRGSTIIDSSYNASPATMLESLKLLKKLAGTSRKIAVIGDMRELGISSKIAHKELADWIRLYCDEVILFGDLVKEYTLPVLFAKKFPVTHFSTMSELIKYLQKSVKPNSHILIKGSQNEILLERAVESILLNKSEISKLCRRGPYWDKIRSKTK